MTTDFATHFTANTRANGDTYFSTSEGCPAWLRDAVREAHQGTLPNDWIYAECRAAVAAFDAGDLADEDGDDVHGYVDGRVDVYTKDLYQWAADLCLTDTFAAAEEEARDMGLPEETEDRIKWIQYAAVRHVADTMYQACAQAAKAENP